MAKKLLAFLGTSNYGEVIYTLKDKEAPSQKFIQASLAELLCNKWRDSDYIYIFLTKGAEEKNWPGLKETLENLSEKSSLPFPKEHIIPVKDIPDGKDESEIWEIFNNIVKQINDNDEIYFDITHGFRHLPMLAIIVLNYVRVVRRNINIGGIYYGAYEARSNGIAPILELKDFENLMRWTAGVDRFVGTGDASILSSLVKEKELNEASAEKKLVESMEEFGNIMATCRGRKIGEGAKAVKGSIEEFKISLEKERKPGMSPLVHLLGKIEDKMMGFGDDDIKNGLEAVKWCIEHNMTQQGYTILREIILTWLAGKHYGYESDELYNRNKRELFGSGLYCVDLPEEKWKPEELKSNRNKIKVENIRKIDNITELKKIFVDLGEYRNDINHAGWREDAKEIKDILKNFEKCFKYTGDFLLK